MIEKILAFLTPIAIIVAVYLQHGKLHEIHVLVNSQMTAALNEIATLKAKIAALSPLDETAAADARQEGVDAGLQVERKI